MPELTDEEMKLLVEAVDMKINVLTRVAQTASRDREYKTSIIHRIDQHQILKHKLEKEVLAR